MKQSYDLAEKNILRNKLEKNIILINAALSKNDGISALSISFSNPNSNSISPANSIIGQRFDFDSSEKINTISMESLITKFNLKSIDLLKMDCEGCEYDVLKNLPDEVYKMIKRLVLEFHDGLKFIPQLLESKGFGCDYEHSEGIGVLIASKLYF